MRTWLLCLVSIGVWVGSLPAAGWEVKPDPAWQACFERRRGWLGADGAYSVPLEGNWTGWLFSDTFVGQTSSAGALLPGFRFLHNSWARLAGSQPALAIFSDQPLLEGAGDRWFWVSQPVLGPQRRGYLFLGQFASAAGPEGLNFAQTGSFVGVLDWRGQAPRLSSLTSLPHFRPEPSPLHFGAAALVEGDQVYVYGTRDFHTHRHLLVARAPWPGLTQFGRWRFWDGRAWAATPESGAPVLEETSNEFSVYRHGTEYRLLHQVGRELRLHRATRPEGPWNECVVIYRTPEEAPLWTYNAKAHPHCVDGEGGMLVTYNCNALPPEKVLERIDRYRPRCLRLIGDPWTP